MTRPNKESTQVGRVDFRFLRYYSNAQSRLWARVLEGIVSIMSAPCCNAALIGATFLLWLLPTNPANAFQQPPLNERQIKREQPAPESSHVPLTLEQMPAVPPKVNFANGLLTIVAENSTLGDVLRAVGTQTGATIEISTDATERVVAHLGPGAARDIVTKLMNGSHFNYVILGSAAQSDHIDRVILTPMLGAPLAKLDATAIPMEGSSTSVPVRIAEQPEDDSVENPANTASDKDNQASRPRVNAPEESSRDSTEDQQQQQRVSHGEVGAPPK
jgi:hypothetical protein